MALGAALFCRALSVLHRPEAAGECAAAHEAALIGLPADHPDRALALWVAGDAEGRPALAAQALAILERRQGDVVLTAAVRMSVARAVAASDPKRSRALATAARDALVAALGPRSRRAAEIARFLDVR